MFNFYLNILTQTEDNITRELNTIFDKVLEGIYDITF